MAATDQTPSSQADAPKRPAVFVVADHTALDFLNTRTSPYGVQFDWLSDGADLLDWLVTVKALDAATAEHLAAIWNPARIDQAAAEAGELREWFRAALKQRHKTGEFSPEVIERLNDLLKRDSGYGQISAPDADGHRHISDRLHWGDPGQLLVPIAASIANLVCEADFSLVRKCENPVCNMRFYDRTKGHRRRWCTQALCGNRAKVAAFRERQRKER